MKLTSVEIHPENSSNILVLSFRDPRRNNPYNVKTIIGLDADQIVPRFYGVSGNSTSKFYELSLENREIIVSVELNPNFTDSESYSDLRDELYKMISSSRTGKVQLQFKNGVEVLAAISGFVSKLESPHFERTQTVQITIKCDEPMLKAVTPVVVAVGSI